MFLILYVYNSLGFKQISPTPSESVQSRPAFKRYISNLSPDDRLSRKTELFCVAINDLKGAF